LAVRVKLEIRTGNNIERTIAIINSGFEADDPEIIIPEILANKLNLIPSGIVTYEVVGRGGLSGGIVREPIKVRLILSDRESEFKDAIAVIIPNEDEVIVSDNLASKLGIVLIDPLQGIWCLRDEIGKRERKSLNPQYWR